MGRVAGGRINGDQDQCQRHRLRSLPSLASAAPLGQQANLLESIRESGASSHHRSEPNCMSLESKSHQTHLFQPASTSASSTCGNCCCQTACAAKSLRSTCCAHTCASYCSSEFSSMYQAQLQEQPQQQERATEQPSNIIGNSSLSPELLPERGSPAKDYSPEDDALVARLNAPESGRTSLAIGGKFIKAGEHNARDRCTTCCACADRPPTHRIWYAEGRRDPHASELSRQLQVSSSGLTAAGQTNSAPSMPSCASSSSASPSPSSPNSQPESDCHSGSTQAIRSSPPSELAKRAIPYASSEPFGQQRKSQRLARDSGVPVATDSSLSTVSNSSTSIGKLPKYPASGASKTSSKSLAKARESGQQKHHHQQQQQQKQNKQQLPLKQQQKQAKATADWNNVDWRYIARRYREMPRQHRGQFWWTMRKSCFCHVLLASLNSFFPILSSFKDYSLPGHLLTDLMAGFTIAVLHIPQGMAYGMLSGVEPIYGLYVSFVPVLVMALMSKSRHVSYGTFAVISMILAASIDSVRIALKQQMELAPGMKLPTPEPLTLNSPQVVEQNLGVVITNNHQAAASDPAQGSLRSLLISSELINAEPSSALEAPTTSLTDMLQQNYTGLPAQPTADSPWSSFNSQAEFVFPTNIEILTCLCLICGLIQMAMSLSRLGILSLMFSDQLVSGFTTASAINVVTSQLSGLFDLSLPVVGEGLFKICRTWWAFGARLYEGFNQYAALISLVSILFLLSVKELLEPALRKRFKSLTCLPSELVLMGALISASWYWQFEQTLGINVVGHVPTGLPTPQVPRLDLAPLVLKDSITVALVSFAMNLSLAQVYAKKFKYSMDPNQELFALGTSNLVGSFFSCFPCASSLSRSAIQSSMNVRSQLCSLFSCAVVVSIICYFAPILHDLPRCALSCIIIVALKGILVQIRDLGENWRLSKLDALVWLMTFMSVIAFGITYGLIVGVVASLFMMLFRLLTPNHSILGHLQGTDIFVDTTAFSDCKEIDQVKIFRFNSALCYLNRTMFKACVEKSLPAIYRQQSFNLFCSDRKRDVDSDKVKFLIIDCSALAYCDYSGAATLVDIIEELEEHKVSVFLAACPLKLINMIERMQKLLVLEHNVYPTIADAIHCAKYLKRGSFQVT